MLSFLKRKTIDPDHQPAQASKRETALSLQVPKYPPVDPGIPSFDPAEILSSQAEFLAKIRRAAGCDDDTFSSRYLQPIKAVARYLHLLPASSHDHFSGPGGLFRFCLEEAFYCLQAADGRIFTPLANVEARHALEPRWKYAAFLAGLVSEIYRPLACAVVTDERGEQWPKFMGGLYEWLMSGSRKRYFVTWQSGTKASSGAEGAAVLGQIVPREALTWLDSGSPAITRDLFAVALGQASRQESIVADVVESIREGILKREEVTRRSRYGHLCSGNHLEAHLLDVIRNRLARGEWKVHRGEEGPVYFGTDGLYLLWPDSAAAIRSDLTRDGIAGVPNSAYTLAEILGGCGALVKADRGQWLWTIVVSDLGHADQRKTAIRFAEPIAALGYVEATCRDRPFGATLVDQAASNSKNSLVDCIAAEATERPKAGPGTIYTIQPLDQNSGNAGPESAPPPDDLPVHSKAMMNPSEQVEAAPAGVSEPLRLTLKPVETELIDWWISNFKDRKTEFVVELTGRQVAVSADWLSQDGVELTTAIGLLDRRGWLGRGDWNGRGTKVGAVQFGDAKKMGFVINREGAEALGFFG